MASPTGTTLYAGDRVDTWQDLLRRRPGRGEPDYRVNNLFEVARWRWSQYAACRDTVPEDWFKDDHPGENAAVIEILLQICKRCPVREACLRYAIEHNEWGIWGGTTDDERRAAAGMKKRR